MKIKYRSTKFSHWRQDLVDKAEDILDEYAAQGVDLTLRGLYYKFVSRKLFPDHWANSEGVTNNQLSYDKLGVLITEARYAGAISWSALKDLTRELEGGGGMGTPESMVRSIANYYSLDKWEDQPEYVELWLEKDAVSSYINSVVREYNLPFQSCRGYMSVTSMHESAKRIHREIRNGKKVTILHMGDHDPSGIDMSRDITDRLTEFLGKDASAFRLDRIGLNMDQVQELGLPPDPAKLSDGRAKAYMEKFNTRFSWELDALEPDDFTRIVTSALTPLIDTKLWDERTAKEKREKNVLLGVSDNWPAIVEFIGNL